MQAAQLDPQARSSKPPHTALGRHVTVSLPKRRAGAIDRPEPPLYEPEPDQRGTVALTDLSRMSCSEPAPAAWHRKVVWRRGVLFAVLVLAGQAAPAALALAQPAPFGPRLGTPQAQPAEPPVKPHRPMTPGVNYACRADYEAHCSGRDVSGAAHDACLKQNWVNLSQACRASLQQHKSEDAPDDDEP